ncbi:hypothetical protein TRFO_04127 [Tritrichomonas foetus]|uniref:F5/8 type C domain-containing protein n=1 Tax=Tritrichomonas foetus TaxID=1144522 RepID=A0A1J4KHF9_9EUKA|nr:hypothetical protein TRFO_04127 [Tritrichomonas foetus]|eukprot:OHT10635.1 hypothetical protein TRFO_04127 [Tritrichomonas foetus]
MLFLQKKNINNENPRLNSNEIDDMKENILSENLNLSISSELLFEIKFEVLYRILTSPKRKIDNHHQLFRFILQIFDEFLEHNSNILNNENRNLNSLPDNRIYNSKREKLLITVSTKEQIQMLTSILDYEQMNQKEIEEMIKHPLFCDSYQPAHTRNFIQQMLSHQKELEKTIESSKTQIEDFKQIIAEQCSTYKVHFHELEENNRKLQDLNKSLQDQLSIQLSKQFLDHQGKMNKIENTLLEKIEQKIPVHIERIYNKKYQTRIKQLQNKDLDLENQIKQQISCTTDFNTKITNIDQEQKKQDKFIQQLQTQLSKSNKNQIIKINSALQSLNYGTYFEISYSNKNKDKGIIYVLRSIYSGNLHKLGILSISGNPEYSNDPSCLATKYSGCYYSKDELDSFISFDFRDHQVSLERYIFHNDCDFYCKKLSLKSWILEGSNDNISWGMLHKCNNCTMYGMYNVFTSQNTGKFRYIRLRMTGPNPSGNHVLHLHKIDFFGKYFPEYS